MSSAADADAGDRLHYSKPSDRARPRYRTPTSSRERRAPAGPNRSPTKYTYLFFFSNLLADLSVPKWRPSGRIPGVACLRLIENPSSILVSRDPPPLAAPSPDRLASQPPRCTSPAEQATQRHSFASTQRAVKV